MEGQRILIVKPSSFGDVVHALPFLHVVRRNFPDAYVAWVVSRSIAGLLEGHPELDEVIVFERERWGGMKDFLRSCGEFSHFARRLRERRFDLVVDLQGLFRSGILTFVTGAARRVGFAGAREWSQAFYNLRVDVPDADMHAVDRYLLVARSLGLRVNGRPAFNVPVGGEAREFADDYLARVNAGGRPLAVMLPSSRWVTKRWPAARFAALADRMAGELDAAVLLLGAAVDAPLARSIAGAMTRDCLSLAGETTLKQSAALMERAAVVVANDTGPMHLAVALGRPVVALYGPTSPSRTGPYGGTVRLLRSTRECAPCFRPGCPRPECMTDIAVDDVFGAVTELLEANR